MEREIVEADESPEHEQARIESVGRAIGGQPPTPFPTDVVSARDKGRGKVRETEGPISASLGAMRPLIGRLDMLLLAPPRGCSSKKVVDRMRLLRDDVEKINSYLNELSEVEDPPLTAKCWMNEARDLSYGMEDYINSLLFVQPEDPSKLVASNIKTTRSLRKSSSNVKTPKNQLIIAETLSEFRMYIQEAIERHQRHNLHTCSTLRHRFVSPGPMLLPMPYEETADVVIDGRMKEFINSLANDGDQQLKMLSVLGPACVGKTTLARVLYNKLGKRYHCRAFIRVSKKPDMKRIFRDMLLQLQGQDPPEHPNEIDLTDNIKTYLRNKRYLIIIDDVWATSVWDIINHAFPKGNHGSRIITTTQIEDVALTCCCYMSEYVFEMKHLDDDHSRKLFFNRLFGSESDCPEQFKEILNEIIEICDGLPLAIISIASLLASQPVISIDLLKYIHQTLRSCFSASERLRQVLNLAFNNLPHYLKTCLLYLIMYPEGYTFYNDDLVKQWMAESFIHRTEGQDMVKVAQSCLDKLIDRGFIQPIRINYNNEVVSCAIHDMVHDLIAHKSAEENFIVAIDYTQKSVSLSHKVRRLSLLFGDARCAQTPANIRKSQVWSLRFFGLLECMPCIGEFKLLRVLNLNITDHGGDDDPIIDLTLISQLFQLRYLKIASDVCIKLPNYGLECLETLDIMDARVACVPCDIHLTHLLHLSLPIERNLLDWSVSKESLGKLNYLQDLHLAIPSTPSYVVERSMEALGSLIGGHGSLKTVQVVAHGSSVKNQLVRGASKVTVSWDDLAPSPLLQRFDCSLHSCIIFYNIPKSVGKLGNLCILKISVRELMMNCVDILRGLPALTALSLYVQRAPIERIVFDKPGFSVLRYFKLRFTSGIAWIKFEADAMPNLWKLKLVFNAIPPMDQHLLYSSNQGTFKRHQCGTAVISIENMPGLKKISVKFGGAVADVDYAWRTFISNHPSNPTINMQSVDYSSYGDESTKQKQQLDEILEEEPDEYEKALERPADKRIPRPYLSKEKEEWISRSSKSSSHLHFPAMGCLPFLHGEVKEEYAASKSAPVQFFSMMSTEREIRSDLDLKSMNVSDVSAESTRTMQYPSFTDRPTKPRVFTLSEIKDATHNFSQSLMVGEGGFGLVYWGAIKNSDEPTERIEIAVKLLKHRGVQGHKEWLAEMNVLGTVEHPNLVKLIGYCAEDDGRGMHRLLIYEYMSNGSVYDHLASRSTSTLSWPMRLKVALHAAGGLKCLHEEMDFQVIFRDVKTSNILLDENWNAKLSDFGLARYGPEEGLTHVSTQVIGTLGYASPEYVQTGRLTSKHDVWGYGVLLYELITGRRPIDGNRPKGEQKLLDWVKPYVSDVKRLPMIVDPRLEGYYELKSMAKLVTVANYCLGRLPKSRPKMSKVYEMVHEIVDSITSGPPEPPLHYHGPISEPVEKQMKKVSLKRIFREFKFQIVWRLKKSNHPKEKTIKGRFADKIGGGAPDSPKTKTTHSSYTSSLLSSYAVGTETSTSTSSC